MQYALAIRESNVKPHLDIEQDIATRKNGLFTFTIRVNGGNIVDYVVTEYVEPRTKYGIVKAIIVEQFTITRSDRK